ncbi:MAG: CinA family nicotinamide mononucleotide deamidase-related protein [Chlorobi bacterium]|nr:CinA family nicotinamide mononucleotide deamidase-related protein [Chlorobiota bacterium]
MQTEIITIGNELLIGQVIDTNSAWIGEQLNKEGFSINRITSISDNADEIKDTVTEALKRVDIVLITGGLGPTKDDITKKTLAELFDTKLVFNEVMYNNVQKFLKGRGLNTVNELNKAQALVPENCTPIVNKVGTAPIMWFEKNGKIVVSMPGVPLEMKTAIKDEIIPRLKKKFNSGVIIHQTILVFDYPEAELAEKLHDWENALPKEISLAYLPAPGRVRLRLTARGENKKYLESLVKNEVKKLDTIIGNNIYGYADEPPAAILGRLLKEKKATVATAESCTGGTIGHLITAIPGSSEYFKGGVIAYANSIKEEVLGVKHDTLETYGAVSREVVEQMAEGARKLMKTDYAIATSGIAGPGGEVKEKTVYSRCSTRTVGAKPVVIPGKPVGTVWIAISTPEKTFSIMFSFGKIRERNIQRSAEYGLVLLIKYLETGKFYKKA